MPNLKQPFEEATLKGHGGSTLLATVPAKADQSHRVVQLWASVSARKLNKVSSKEFLGLALPTMYVARNSQVNKDR